MEMTAQNFMPILFDVLCAFLIINMIIYFVLQLSKHLKIYKLMAIYWPTTLLAFIMQASFQMEDLRIFLAYSVSIISCSIAAMIGLEILGRKFPLKKYLVLYLMSCLIAFLLGRTGLGITATAMPFAIASAVPMLHTAYYILVVDRKKSTLLQKFLGGNYFLVSIHAINFAFFRMDPGAQLWGWLVTYALYDLLAVLLPATVVEEVKTSENKRIQDLVTEKTWELNMTLKDNRNLLKTVLHDLSGPLMTMRFYLWYLKPGPENEEIIKKAKKSQHDMENIIQDIKKHLYPKT